MGDKDLLSGLELDWKGYRKIKHRLIVLLAGWIPFGIVDGGLLPLILHSYTASYVIALVYMIWTAVTWLQYGFYPCPSCGRTLRGAQLYRRTCPKCRVRINPPADGK